MARITAIASRRTTLASVTRVYRALCRASRPINCDGRVSSGSALAIQRTEGSMHSFAARAALMGMLVVRQLGLGPHVRPVDKPDATIDQLWQAPQDLSRRDLFVG